ncbi:MAG: glycosyltransferase family 39 protein [Candidatus Rokubacteria bacterium]|nr:glycosyltransferase family 39 protein [Candidatus Rokubacteria bacterium]
MTARPLLILVGATILCLAPFADKAFHIDDPLFLWAARHILSDPVDFYGFGVNWYGTDMAMSTVFKNPPLTSYSIALVASLVGWSEVALHLAFLVPAAAAAVGTYVLARRCCSHPLAAALVGLFTPAFLVSGTSVMSDTMMLALWVWTVALWLHGLERNDPRALIGSAVLLALCALTKYYGMSLIPLLLVYSLARRRRPGWWALCLLLPAGALALYQWATYALYGRGLLFDAASYATNVRYLNGSQLLIKGLIGLAFAGGSLATIALYTPLLWSRRLCAAGILLVAVLTFTLPAAEKLGGFALIDADGVRWGPVIQLALFATAGISPLALAGADLRSRRDAASLLLFLWVAGTFVFASFLNWSVNVRSILPMAPAAGILVMRRIEARGAVAPGRRWRVLWPLVPGACVALLVAWTDYSLANTARSVAAEIHDRYRNRPGTVWFQGHWGFQYYMEARGGKALDRRRSRLAPGDIVVIPANNTNVFAMPPGGTPLSHVIERPVPGWLATMSTSVGAGFYSDIWGPLPFSVGAVPAERYAVLTVSEEIHLR